MTTNNILDDLHDTRRRLLVESGGTIETLGAALRKRQQESARSLKREKPPDVTERRSQAIRQLIIFRRRPLIGSVELNRFVC